MNTLDDLRAALEREGQFPDRGAAERSAAVRRRVRAVRRRRATTAVVATVLAVLAAVTGGSLLGGGSHVEPTKRTGEPGQVRLSGFPYALTRVVHPRPGEKVAVDTTRPGRAAVLVAHGLGRGTATLYLGNLPVARLLGDGRSGAVPLFPVTPGQDSLRVEVGGAPGARVGIALYERTGGLAEGVSNGETVFRRHVGGVVRVGAVFADPGAREATLTVRASLHGLLLRLYCATDQKRIFVQVSIDGDLPSGTDCSGGDGIDGGGLATGAIGGDTGTPEHTVRVFVTRGPGLDPVSDPAISYGVGAYVPSRRTVEYLGRTWVLDHVVRKQSADIRTGNDDRLMRIVGQSGTATWSGRIDRRTTTAEVHDFAPGPTGDGTLLLRGDTYHVEVSAPAAIEIYRPR